MIVPNTQDLMHDVTMSQDVMARQAESSMTLAETPYTVSARPTLAARPAMHPQISLHQTGIHLTSITSGAKGMSAAWPPHSSEIIVVGSTTVLTLLPQI